MTRRLLALDDPRRAAYLDARAREPQRWPPRCVHPRMAHRVEGDGTVWCPLCGDRYQRAEVVLAHLRHGGCTTRRIAVELGIRRREARALVRLLRDREEVEADGVEETNDGWRGMVELTVWRAT